MILNNLNKRERYLAIATAIIIITAVAYAFVIGPMTSRWVDLNKQIRSKVDMLEKDYAILANRLSLESEYAKFSKHAWSAKNEEQVIADTLSFIENVSANDSCRILNIKPVGITDTGSYKEIVIDVTVEANIGELSKFLYDIENPRDNLINVKSFSLSAKSGQAGMLKGTFFINKILLD